jgi:hypothetical protein
MLRTMQSKQIVSADGRIRVEMPFGHPGQSVDVLVVVSRPVQSTEPAQATHDWREFVHEMAGSCAEMQVPADPPPAPLESLP